MTSRHQEEFCSECDADAIWYCVQDDANYCDEHNAMAHTLKSQKSHRIVPIDAKQLKIEDDTDKPMNCKNHHMPLCLYCLVCKDVCCVACLSVDIHKQHSDQVKSVVDVANGERERLNEHLERLQKLKTAFTDEQDQLEQALRNIDISETEGHDKIDREFDRMIACVEARRKFLKKQLHTKSKNYREHVHSRQEDLKNITSSLNRCLDEGQDVLSLNDFVALTHSKSIIERIKALEMEGVEYCNQVLISHSLQFHMSSQSILDLIGLLGFVGMPPIPSLIQEKCKADVHHLHIEWKAVEYDPPVTAYVLELGHDDNDFKEVYRGLDTMYHLTGLQPNALYSLRLYTYIGGEMQRPAILEMRTSKIDLNNWTLSMSSTYATLEAENTRESLIDGQFTTGAATDIGAAWIKATFPYPVLVNSVTIAPLHKNPSAWGPMHGNSGSLQYSHDNMTWTTVGTIAYADMKRQRITVDEITARYWRLSHNSYLGTSSFLFE